MAVSHEVGCIAWWYHHQGPSSAALLLQVLSPFLPGEHSLCTQQLFKRTRNLQETSPRNRQDFMTTQFMVPGVILMNPSGP